MYCQAQDDNEHNLDKKSSTFLANQRSARFASTRIRVAPMSPPRVVPSATHKSVCHSVRIFSPSTCLLSFGNFTNTICSELIKAYCRLDQCTMERCSDRNDLFRVIESVGIVGIGSIVRTTRRPTAHSSQKSFREQRTRRKNNE
jgi:hypothetical protein